jgi:uncharacterized YigZ family protein
MQIFSYKTIDAPAEGLYKEKGSKFLAFAYPVASEDEIKENLAVLRRKYFDARHHCYAWMLGADRKLFRANDDGEPNHSAGDPILGQIRSREITNVLLVVVRYFGGVKLGVGGLISAYKMAADDALSKCTIVELDVVDTITIEYAYEATPEAMKLVKDFGLKILTQTFDEQCRMTFEFTLVVKPLLLDRIRLLQATGTSIIFL